MKKPRPPPDPLPPPPEIISAATTTFQVMPMPTEEPTTMDGKVAGSGSGGGLGFFIWNSYVGGSYEQIVVGMISIGIAGFACSEVLRALGGLATPWLQKR